jgi:hypothetical protein
MAGAVRPALVRQSPCLASKETSVFEKRQQFGIKLVFKRVGEPKRATRVNLQWLDFCPQLAMLGQIRS